jgi:hypothetical protein
VSGDWAEDLRKRLRGSTSGLSFDVLMAQIAAQPADPNADVHRMRNEAAELNAEMHRIGARIDADFERAAAVVATLTITRRELRKRASLVLRCADCDGQVFAHVTYVEGRPLMWARGDRQGKVDSYLWLDGAFWGNCGWCDVREWVLDCADIREVTPPPGAKQVTGRIAHGDIVGAVP